MRCDRSGVVVSGADGLCRVATQDVNRMLKGQGWVTMHLEKSGGASLEFLKQSVSSQQQQ